MAKAQLVLEEGYLNSLTEIVSEENYAVAYARISRIGEDFLEFVPGRNETEMPVLLYGVPLKVNIHNSRMGLKVFSGTVAGSTPDRMKVGSLEMLTDTERRQFLRVNVGVEAEITHLAAPEGGGMHKKPVGCTVEDISLSGLRFSTPAQFILGDRISVCFTLMDFTMALECIVKRIIAREDASSNHYGCFFTRLSTGQEENMHKLMLRLQQARRARY